MPRNLIFLIFTHQIIQSPRQVFSVTGPNLWPSYCYFESSKLYFTGSSSPGYKAAPRGRGSITHQPLSLLHLLVSTSKIMKIL